MCRARSFDGARPGVQTQLVCTLLSYFGVLETAVFNKLRLLLLFSKLGLPYGLVIIKKKGSQRLLEVYQYNLVITASYLIFVISKMKNEIVIESQQSKFDKVLILMQSIDLYNNTNINSLN